MKIKVLFFGLTRDLTGLQEELAEVQAGETARDLRRRYCHRFPRLGEIHGSLLVAVNEEVTDGSRLLEEGDEVALMPPVSGGAPDDLCLITTEEIRASDLACKLTRPSDGAVVTFEGVVREQSHGRRTLYLEYEAYTGMAVRTMETIAAECRRQFEIDRVGMVHRVGRLEIGETSVAIVVTAAHRGPAFEACRYAIDRLKQTVPIWKREYFEDGAVWAEGEGQTRILAV